MLNEYPAEAGTALGAAFIRAAHVEMGDGPYVFNDYLAGVLLTKDDKQEFREYFSNQYANWLKEPWFRAANSTVPEDYFAGYMQTSPLVPEILARQAYAESYVSGTAKTEFRQYVILGAGLDTFALRNPYPGLMVFEADRRAVSDFKRQRAISSGLFNKEEYISVPVDFESEDLAECLMVAGLKSDIPSLVSWLGVTPYLSLEGIKSSFEALSSVLCQSSVVVFDYTLPDALNRFDGCPFTIELAGRLAEQGEPLQINLRSEDYMNVLARTGFRLLENLTPRDIQSRYFAGRVDRLEAASFVCLAAAVLD